MSEDVPSEWGFLTHGFFAFFVKPDGLLGDADDQFIDKTDTSVDRQDKKP